MSAPTPDGAGDLWAAERKLAEALGAYRLWGNTGVQATTVLAVAAECITHLETIAKAADAVLSAARAARIALPALAPAAPTPEGDR
jgi:hypothetical protein